MPYSLSPPGARWITLPSHRRWLLQQAEALFGFFERESLDPRGGFHELDLDGRPLHGAGAARQLHVTTRMVHCYSIAHLMGRPGASEIIDHGMDFLWNHHRDTVNGGYLWGIGPDGPSDDTKQAYGHAFVLLAASSATLAGHPDGQRLLSDVTAVLRERFWEEDVGASAEQFTRDWQSYDAYRGQNSNMHLTEALMAAFEATGRGEYLEMATRVAELIVRRHAAANAWRLPEHFDADWQVDFAYSGDPVFRPHGTTPGHWLEWSRLLLQLWEMTGRESSWMPEAARALFARAVGEGWCASGGGFYYTLDWDGTARIAERYWWPCCEGIGAAAFLNAIDGDERYEHWYREIWNFAASRFIDRREGGWFPQIDDEGLPSANPFHGKPDVYHALQACLIPLLPSDGSVVAGVRGGGLHP